MFGWRQSFSTAKKLLHYRTRLDEVLEEGRVVVGVFWNCWAANKKTKVIFSVEFSSELRNQLVYVMHISGLGSTVCDA